MAAPAVYAAALIEFPLRPRTLNVPTVHIIGAGFSRAAGLPLCSDLLSEVDRFMVSVFKDYCVQSLGYAYAHYGLYEDGWLSIRELLLSCPRFADCVSIDSSGRLSGNIETVLTRLDEDIGSDPIGSEILYVYRITRRYRGIFRQRTKVDEVMISRNEAIDIRRYYIPGTLAFYFRWITQANDSSRLNSAGVHAVLKYFFTQVRPGDTLISFNYDTLAEWALSEASRYKEHTGLSWSVGDGLGFDLSKCYCLFEGPNPAFGRNETGSNVLLLNLHGSMLWTWHTLQEKFVLDYSLFTEGMIVSQGRMLPVRRSLMCEPSMKKTFSHHIFDVIWDSAAKRLAAAERLVCIGYSAPEADERAKSLLACTTTKPEYTILIVDPIDRQHHWLGRERQAGISYERTTLDRWINAKDGRRLAISTAAPLTAIPHEILAPLPSGQPPEWWKRLPADWS